MEAILSSVKTRPKILIGIAVPLLLAVTVGVIALTSLNQILVTAGWVNHTNNVLRKANGIVASAVDMETGMRGYLLAGQTQFLEPYVSASGQIFQSIEDLQQTVSDNPPQVDRLGEAASILQQWQDAVVTPNIQLRKEIGDSETMNDIATLVGEARGKTYFDKFRGQIGTFVERERGLLTFRKQQVSEVFEKSVVETNVAERAIGWVTETSDVIKQANDILAAAINMETGMRGYLLAGKEEFLEPYAAGSAEFFRLTEDLRQTVSANPGQVRLLQEIDETIREWKINVTEPMIALRREIGSAKTMDDMADLIGEARGKTYFDKFRSVMADFVAEEEALMEIRIAENVATESRTQILIAGGIALAILIGLGLGWIISGAIIRPLRSMTDTMQRLASGDKTVDVGGAERKDEIGEMAATVQVFKDNLIKADELTAREASEQQARAARASRIDSLTTDFDQQISALLSTVADSASKMEGTATSLATMAADTDQRSTNVAAASEQATSNVQSVASATDELSSSILEIGRQVSQSTNIAQRAVDEASETNQQVQSLSEAAQRISDVVSLISAIAEQTNLLALNATIEAARAGDAGKGFAVVANEVKSLASQTAKATEEIEQQIGTVQSETERAVNAIQSIGGTIAEINEISITIASAIEEQTAATGEIARNVEQAAVGTQDVSQNIAEVTQTAGDAKGVAGTVTKMAQDLTGSADALKAQVESFLSDVRAA